MNDQSDWIFCYCWLKCLFGSVLCSFWLKVNRLLYSLINLSQVFSISLWLCKIVTVVIHFFGLSLLYFAQKLIQKLHEMFSVYEFVCDFGLLCQIFETANLWRESLVSHNFRKKCIMFKEERSPVWRLEWILKYDWSCAKRKIDFGNHIIKRVCHIK